MEKEESTIADRLTVKECAVLWQITKQAVRARLSKLPSESVTRETNNGKEIIWIDKQAAVVAWGLPPYHQTPQVPQNAGAPEGEAIPAQPETAPESVQSAEIEELRRYIAAITEELDAVRHELETVKQERDEAQKELYNLSREKDRLQFEMDGMSAAVDIQDRERETLTATVETLKAQLSEKDRQISELHQLQLAALRTALPAPRQGLLSRIFGGKRKQEQ